MVIRKGEMADPVVQPLVEARVAAGVLAIPTADEPAVDVVIDLSADRLRLARVEGEQLAAQRLVDVVERIDGVRLPRMTLEENCSGTMKPLRVTVVSMRAKSNVRCPATLPITWPALTGIRVCKGWPALSSWPTCF